MFAESSMSLNDQSRCDEATMKCLETLLKCIEDPFLHKKSSKMHGFSHNTEKFYLDDKKRIPEKDIIFCTNQLLIKRKHIEFLEARLKAYIRSAKERPTTVNPDVFVRMLQLAAYTHYEVFYPCIFLHKLNGRLISTVSYLWFN